jgi:hypothetical protein
VSFHAIAPRNPFGAPACRASKSFHGLGAIHTSATTGLATRTRLIHNSNAVNIASLSYQLPPYTGVFVSLMFGETYTGIALMGMVLTVWAVIMTSFSVTKRHSSLGQGQSCKVRGSVIRLGRCLRYRQQPRVGAHLLRSPKNQL